MMKTLIAGVTALSLSVTPVTAQQNDTGFQHQDIATALFALLALGVVGKALTSGGKDDRAAPEPPVVQVNPTRIAPDRGGLPTITRNNWFDQDGRIGERDPRGDNVRGWADARVLPRQCLNTVHTRYGDQRIFARNCLRENYRHISRLPRSCAVRLIGMNGVRNGFDPQCLRDAGYRARR